MQRPPSVLVDTNVILECHRVGLWRAFVGRYQVETVEECVIETQTGHHQRREVQQINVRELRQELSAVHSVTYEERARLLTRVPDIFLDTGEASLWTHAVSRNEDWNLCGPDRVSLRFGIRMSVGRFNKQSGVAASGSDVCAD